MTPDDGRRPIAIGHQSKYGDLKFMTSFIADYVFPEMIAAFITFMYHKAFYC